MFVLNPILHLRSGWIFAQHFLNRLGPAYAALKAVLDEQDTVQATVLSDIRARFRQETFTRASILETLQSYPEIVSQSGLKICNRGTDLARNTDSVTLYLVRYDSLLQRLYPKPAHVSNDWELIDP